MLYRVGVAILALLFCHRDWFEEVRRDALDVECVSHAYRCVKAVQFTVPRGEVGSLMCPWFEQILFLHLHTAYVRPTWVSPVCRMPAVIEVFQFSVPCRLRCRQSSTQGFLGPFSTSPTARLLCAGDTNASLRSPCIAGFQALPRGGAESDFSAPDYYIKTLKIKALYMPMQHGNKSHLNYTMDSRDHKAP